MNNNFNNIFGNFSDDIDKIFKDVNLGEMFAQFFGGNTQKEKSINDFINLGNGYELRPIEKMKDMSLKYSHLYHNGLKISGEIFRKGGTSGTFKAGYISLIHYMKEPIKKPSDSGISFGNSVIVNDLGEICLSQNSSNYPSHVGGHIGKLKDFIYDLRSGVIIMNSSGKMIVGEDCIYIEHSHEFGYYTHKFPIGIYKINLKTAEVTLIDNIEK